MHSEIPEVRLELGVKQTMRDGTRLSADLFIPEGGRGKYPVIVTRTPYRTVEGFQRIQNDEAIFFARHGYVYIIQDCRGKNDSEGVYRPFLDDDARDGYDTLTWCKEQEWSDGSIGTIGASYQAWNQWTTATLKPPGLKAMISVVALPDPVLNVPFQNGALVLWMSEWMAMVEGRRNTITSLFESARIFWHLPLKTMDQKFGWRSTTWQEWIQHPSADKYWKQAFYQDKYDSIDVPVLHVSGWYDDDVIGTHLNYVGMRHHGKSKRARQNQKLIIGPWQHYVNATRRLGQVDFGEAALIDLRSVQLRWFDHWLKGEENGIDKEKPVATFLMGANAWKERDRWPPEGMRLTPFYLRSRGKANTAFGDGTLGTSRPERRVELPPDTYRYDPADPCPNIYDESGDGPAEAPLDQRPIERRDDVLVYSTPPLRKELEVSGPVKVKLFASSSARDTDFWAQLVDVFPTGYSMHLTEGIIRGRYRKSLERPEYLKPGEVTGFEVNLWVTSNLFRKGHRIRLDISSSSFPKYDRNPNTAHPFGQDAELRVAMQTIYHDGRYPSCVVIPIVPNY